MAQLLMAVEESVKARLTRIHPREAIPVFACSIRRSQLSGPDAGGTNGFCLDSQRKARGTQSTAVANAAQHDPLHIMGGTVGTDRISFYRNGHFIGQITFNVE
jgi:hypothetical protein